MVCIGIDMHILSWQITALVEREIVLKVNKIEVPFLLITV